MIKQTVDNVLTTKHCVLLLRTTAIDNEYKLNIEMIVDNKDKYLMFYVRHSQSHIHCMHCTKLLLLLFDVDCSSTKHFPLHQTSNMFE